MERLTVVNDQFTMIKFLTTDHLNVEMWFVLIYGYFCYFTHIS